MTTLNNPAEIYARSFAIVRAEANLGHLDAAVHEIAIRIIHACGMTEIAPDLQITPDAAAAMRAALAAGRPVFTDCEMVRHGIIPRALPPGVKTICTLNDPRAKPIGLAQNITRSAAAVSLWGAELQGAIAVIGNAPTALFALLDAIDRGGPRPACIVGLPVGFVGAAEAKAELIANPRGIAYVALRGRRGGSAMAAAAINAAGLERAA